MSEDRTRRRLLAALVVVAAVAFAVGGPRLLRGPAFIDRVAIVNPSEYDLDVDVSGGHRDGWMSVTTAHKGSTTQVEEVIDQGAVWVFRFKAAGYEGGELRTEREDLRRAGWSIEVPASVIDHLRQQGAPTTP